ncbi:hypothetical protein GCM10023210_32560 [Chryseobacterium ginsengisoli]|uniref:Uncharacterized protein n=1 Tax=Chryseobacterium ginsengisoli TaxID=363853 RepID=A0ABP9MJ02_9FLAO
MKKRVLISICVAIIALIILVFMFLRNTANKMEDEQNRVVIIHKKPSFTLSQLFDISENRVKYLYTDYFDGKEVGYLCKIDDKYDVTVTNLGKIQHLKINFFKQKFENFDNKVPLVYLDSLNNFFKQLPERNIDVDIYKREIIRELRIGYLEQKIEINKISQTQNEYNFKESPLNFYVNKSKKINFQLGAASKQDVTEVDENDLGKPLVMKTNSLFFVEYKNELYILSLMEKKWSEL